MIVLGKDNIGMILVSFPYNPRLIEKVKTVPGYKWDKKNKHWSFPDSDGTLTPHSPLNLRGDEGGLVFEGEKIHIAPELEARLPQPVIAVPEPQQKQSQDEYHNPIPPLAKGGEGGFVFEDLRRELVTRKYSYKTVKAYLYYKGERGQTCLLMGRKGSDLLIDGEKGVRLAY